MVIIKKKLLLETILLVVLDRNTLYHVAVCKSFVR